MYTRIRIPRDPNNRQVIASRRTLIVLALSLIATDLFTIPRSTAIIPSEEGGDFENVINACQLPVCWEGMEKLFLRLTSNTQKPPTDEKSDYNPRHNPIIFIPGDGGSQLEARLNKSERVHYICSLQSDWYDIWLNLHLLTPGFIDCFYDNMRLHYDSKTRTTNNSEGVEIRAHQFGLLDSVAYLDISHLPYTDYFENIIATLEKRDGLVRDVDMVGAAFDFRKAPNELAEYFINLTILIQDQYVNSGYRPVTLICHSMGCLNSLYLLNQKSPQWKEIYVKRLITLGAPWDGSFKAISAMLFGDNLGIPLLDRQKLRVVQASYPSLMYLFPKEPTFNRSQTLIQAAKSNFTLTNLDDLFKTVNMTSQMEMWHDTREIAGNLSAPGVEVWCLYGNKIATPTKIIVESEVDAAFNSWKYTEIQGDGDGTVNLESLEACKAFRKQQIQPVYTRLFEGLDHIEILRRPAPANYISQEILSRDSPA